MLHEFPVELLNQIVSELPTPQSIARLSRCSHALQKYVEDEGWKIYVQKHFPSQGVTKHWKAAAHSLSTLSRNLDRKAFLARYVRPTNGIVGLPERTLTNQWQSRRRRGQGNWVNVMTPRQRLIKHFFRSNNGLPACC